VTSRAGRLLSRVDRAAHGLAADAALYLLSAAFALITGLASALAPHRGWGLIAVWAYLAGFGVVGVQMATRRPAGRMAWTWTIWAGCALLPLVVEAVQRAGGRTDRAQEEVLVVEQMGERLLQTGTPYLRADAILTLPPEGRLLGYAPYQPGMAVFGLPRALAGEVWWTDARVWFAAVTLAALLAAVRTLRPGGPPLVRAVQFATVLPICALTLATGGDDLPVLALCLLALAWCATDRFGPAGVAAGVAAALKLFALPVVVVLAVLALAMRRGRHFLPWALGLPIAVLIPPMLVDGEALFDNVVRFPLGHGVVHSPAQSPFPGYLISATIPGGRYVAAALLVAAAGIIALVLVRRPPRTAATAALICGYGLLAAILLMPTTRFGYLLYPAAFLVWSPALSNPTAHPASRDDAALYRV
jgi:Glycosyltransferase family 87